MGINKTQGIVLRYTNHGEADKILTLLTRSKGKVKAYAKGCRKPKSSLLSSCELFAFSEFVLYKGSSFYHITQAETREIFYNIRNDLLKLSHANYFVELADFVSVEEVASERLFLLLAKALYYLSTGDVQLGILSLGYQLRLMDISGFRPHINRCVSCGCTEGDSFRFSIELGGLICGECRMEDKSAYKISAGSIEMFKIFLNTDISRLNTIKMDNTIFNEMDKIIRVFVQTHLDKRFKSLEFLDEIKNSYT